MFKHVRNTPLPVRRLKRSGYQKLDCSHMGIFKRKERKEETRKARRWMKAMNEKGEELDKNNE